ncbi:MAG: rhomboid family protein [Armatimonadetes bacterium]|jgi:membrane associated rhomboid family serine protease|nr:rhomboid family protein [Armatimonadota bacterium]
MIPLHDENPTRTTPVLTIILIVINLLVFFGQQSMGLDASALIFGLIPAELVHNANNAYPPGALGYEGSVTLYNFNPAWLTVFTSMFLHGSWMHVIGNMWFLWIFGNNVEDQLGKGRFLLFYLLAGVAAAGLQIAIGPGSEIPMVGASGAVAGVLGAYAVIFPGSRVLCLIPLGWIWFTRDLPAWLVLGFWFVLEFLRGTLSLGAHVTGGVAYAAHVGGFIFGLVIGKILGGASFRGGRRPEPRPDFMDWR